MTSDRGKASGLAKATYIVKQQGKADEAKAAGNTTEAKHITVKARSDVDDGRKP